MIFLQLLAVCFGAALGNVLGSLLSTWLLAREQKKQIEAAGKRVSAMLANMQQEMSTHVATTATRN